VLARGVPGALATAEFLVVEPDGSFCRNPAVVVVARTLCAQTASDLGLVVETDCDGSGAGLT
jgi:hypothetical protein